MTVVLYVLDNAYQRLAEVTPDEDAPQSSDPDRLQQELGALCEDLPSKVLALAKVVMGLNAEADLLEQHARSIMARVSSRRHRAEYLKRWIQLQMAGVGVDRLRDAYITVWLQQSPSSVDVQDEQAVPAAFKRAVLRLPFDMVPTELLPFLQHLDVDRAAILALTKRTGELPAGIGIRTGEKHLRIR